MAGLWSSEEVSTKSIWSVLHVWAFTCSDALWAVSKYSLVKLPFSYSSDIQCGNSARCRTLNLKKKIVIEWALLVPTPSLVA